MSDETLKKLVLFNDLAPDVVDYDSIYDPDVDGLDPAAKGKLVPAVKSLVVQRLGAGVLSLWAVDSVDVDYKTHLVRPQIVNTDDDAPNRIVGYGNDTYMLFYDQRGDELRLQLDNKLVFYGTRTSYYKLFKTNSEGVRQVISRRVSATDTITGTAIPILPIDAEDRDTRRVFTTTQTWSALVTNVSDLALRDWTANISFKLNSTLNPANPAATVVPIFHSASSNGRFGIYVNRTTDQLVFWINRGTNVVSWVVTASAKVGVDTSVRFLKYGSVLRIYLDNTMVVNTTTEVAYTEMWLDTFVAPASEGDFVISTLQIEDTTLNRMLWEAPYSSLWSALGLTSPIVLKGDTCLAVDDISLTDGESIYLIVYEEVIDNLGSPVVIETMNLTLLAREATTVAENDLSSVALISLEVDLNGAYTAPESWVLRKGQDPATMSLTPKLVFEDGTVQYVSIDNISCFVYGLSDVSTSVVGSEFDILFKYFPAKSTTLFPDLQNRTDKGMLSCTKTVRIIPAVTSNIAKLSIVPMWDSGTSAYTLKYVAYNKNHSAAIILDNSAISIILGSFVGNSSKFGTNQTFVAKATVVESDDTVTTHSQTLTVQLNNYNNYETKEPWLISEQVGDVLVFGSNSMPYRRPRITYDSVLTQYKVNGVTFDTLEKFLLNFYSAATPPKFSVASGTSVASAPVPTHFVLKDTNGNAITAALPITTQIIDGDDYVTELSFQTPFNITYTTAVNEWVGKTVIMEFLQYNSGVYSVLYGVPVEVR